MVTNLYIIPCPPCPNLPELYSGIESFPRLGEVNLGERGGKVQDRGGWFFLVMDCSYATRGLGFEGRTRSATE